MKEIKNKKAFFTTKWIAYTAVLTALVVATSVIPPIPIGTAKVYWCDGMIFLAAYLMDPASAFIAGGLGSALYDFCLGNVPMALASFVIHGLQAISVSALLHYLFPNSLKKYEWIKALGYSLIGAIIVIGGYFITYWLIFPLLGVGNKYGLVYASARVVRNILQEIIGITLAMVICYATTFKKQLKNNRLLPDFKSEVLQKEKRVNETDDETHTENDD